MRQLHGEGCAQGGFGVGGTSYFEQVAVRLVMNVFLVVKSALKPSSRHENLTGNRPKKEASPIVLEKDFDWAGPKTKLELTLKPDNRTRKSGSINLLEVAPESRTVDCFSREERTRE